MSKPIEEFSWMDGANHRIYGVHWGCDNPRAVLGIVHGIGEHARRYDHYAGWFNQKGVACVGYDRQGHGRSEGKRGHANEYKALVDEVARLTIECEERYPGLPIYLYGHSMGGQLLLRYLIRRNPQITGAVVSAPHIRLPFRPNPIRVLLGRTMRRIKPDFTQPTSIDVSLLARDQSVVERYQNDALVHNLLSAQLGIDMLENARLLDAYASGLTIPTLLIHGDADGVTAFSGSTDFAHRNPANLTFKEFPGFYHELHNEPGWQTVAGVVFNWMAARAPDLNA